MAIAAMGACRRAWFVMHWRRAIVPADDPFSKMGLKKLAPGQKKPETPTATWEELLAFRMADLTISSLALRSALRGELSIRPERVIFNCRANLRSLHPKCIAPLASHVAIRFAPQGASCCRFFSSPHNAWQFRPGDRFGGFPEACCGRTEFTKQSRRTLKRRYRLHVQVCSVSLALPMQFHFAAPIQFRKGVARSSCSVIA